MCLIKKYTCELEKYYYKQFYSNRDNTTYLIMYCQKLPYPWNIYFLNTYNKIKSERKTVTIGARIDFSMTRLKELCQQRQIYINTSKTLAPICCPAVPYPNNWGCARPAAPKTNQKTETY